MVSLADLRARNVQPVWQEAVAVVQELIQSATASGTPLPDLEHVALIPNGDVVAMPGSPEPTDPVHQAATMLRVLADGIAIPPELDEFVKKNLSGSGAAPTLADFARGLSFYERPGRRSDVERLVSRATAAEQTTRADEELRRLKVKAAEASEHRLDDTVFMDTVAMQGRERRRPVVAIAGLVLVAIVATGAWWWWRNRTQAPQPSASAATTTTPAATADRSATAPAAPGLPAVAPAGAKAGATGLPAVAAPAAKVGATGASAQTPGAPQTALPTPPRAPVAPPPASLLDRATAVVKSAVNRIVGPEPEPEHAAASAPAPPPTVEKNVKQPRHKKVAPGVPAPAPEAQKMPVAVAVDEPTPAPAATPAVERMPPVADETIYNMADATVIPPVLVRPVLPKDPPPGVPLDQIGTFEVLVDEQGDVEQVHLVSPANRFHERMLVSAAKMWKFRPAFKDGHPVRYRTKVRITV